jgi:hypothetical protein
MLRHIISVNLAMAACASLIPTRANAINVTLTPLGSLQRNSGDKISFILRFDPQKDAGLSGVKILEVFNPSVFNPSNGTYDSNELSFIEVLPLFKFSENPVTLPKDIAALIFKVTNPIKDGQSDVSGTRIKYQIGSKISEHVFTFGSSNSKLDVQPVPEPLTMLGAAAALGYGVILKRKSSKNRES